MSAIAGLWRARGGGDVSGDIGRMLAVQRCYGPDDGASWCDGGLAMGRRLASLLPEDAHDRQPLHGGGGRYTLVADLRLDDRAALGAALGIEAVRLASMCDADVLLAAWEKWDEDCCARLTGDFAFALWDAERRRLVLARDVVGSRPLHFHIGEGLVAFASMPKGLLALDAIPAAPDLDFVTQTLLHMSFDGDRSYFAGIRRVRPGHVVTIANGVAQQRRYWRPDLTPLRLRGHDDYVAAMRETLDRAVRDRLRGVTDVAAHLSAGLDSSAVATSAALQLGGTGTVTAFTAAPRLGRTGGRAGILEDESELAAATARLHPNMTHVVVRETALSTFDRLARADWLNDQPLPNMCNIAWWNAINDAAIARGHRVMLNGQTGNVYFSHDGFALLPALLRRGRLVRLVREAMALGRGGSASFKGAMALAVRRALPGGMRARLDRRAGRSSPIAAHPDLWRHAALPAPAFPLHGAALRVSYLGRADPGNFLKGQLGGWGLDYRDPTADRRLIELSLRIPEERFMRNGRTRALARGVLAGRVAPGMLAETRRGHQGADWYERAEHDQARIAAEVAAVAGEDGLAQLFDIDRLQRLVAAMADPDWYRRTPEVEHRSALLRTVAVAHFVRGITMPARG
jgi:asparagine synthase (glutamine-hydrolysing)